MAARSLTRAACSPANAESDAATLPANEEMSTWSVPMLAVEPARVGAPGCNALSAGEAWEAAAARRPTRKAMLPHCRQTRRYRPGLCQCLPWSRLAWGLPVVTRSQPEKPGKLLRSRLRHYEFACSSEALESFAYERCTTGAKLQYRRRSRCTVG